MEQYSNYCDFLEKNIYSISFNFFTTVIGAFLGFIFALFIYKLSNKKTSDIQKKAEIQKYFNTLKRFSLLLDSVVDKSRKQNLEFRSYYENLRNHPLNQKSPNRVISNDRNRLVKSDNSDLYKAFMFFDKDNLRNNKDYFEMFTYADYLEDYYSRLFLLDAKHFEDKCINFSSVSINLLKVLHILHLIQIQKETYLGDNARNDNEYIFVRKYLDLKVKLSTELENQFENFKEEFFKPLQHELYRNIVIPENQYQIGIEVSSALTLLDECSINATSLSNEFSNEQSLNDVDISLKALEKINEKIKKIMSHNSSPAGAIL